MPIDITMPALSPTMETGTLAKWLVKVGDSVKSGDILCEIETDKATMEVESIDEGQVAELLVADGAEDIKVGAVIARLTGEGEAAAPAAKENAPLDPPPMGEEQGQRPPSRIAPPPAKRLVPLPVPGRIARPRPPPTRPASTPVRSPAASPPPPTST